MWMLFELVGLLCLLQPDPVNATVTECARYEGQVPEDITDIIHMSMPGTSSTTFGKYMMDQLFADGKQSRVPWERGYEAARNGIISNDEHCRITNLENLSNREQAEKVNNLNCTTISHRTLCAKSTRVVIQKHHKALNGCLDLYNKQNTRKYPKQLGYQAGDVNVVHYDVITFLREPVDYIIKRYNELTTGYKNDQHFFDLVTTL